MSIFRLGEVIMMNIYDFFKEINRSYDLSNSDISQYY